MPSINDNIVYFSITNNLDDKKRDINAPFSFLDFLKYTGANDKSGEFSVYQSYLKDWEKYTNISLTSINVNIRSQFINFLSEIKLLFLNQDERRYFDNIDLNDNEQLTIAVPFFTSKIKEIANYYRKKRSSISGNIEYVKRKGTPLGAERFIKDQLLDVYSGDDVPPGLSVSPSEVDALLNKIDISYERIYDTFNDYYDLSPDKLPTFYDTVSGDRSDYFASNTNTISSSFYLNDQQAIADIYNKQGVGLTDVAGLKVNFNQPDITLLHDSNFVNYVNTGNIEDLNFKNTREIPKDYLGTDMYYLSTSNGKEVDSGRLINANKPYRNLLNINNPATLTVFGNSFKDERSVGLFFKPSVRGMLKMESDFTSYTITDRLDPNTTYIFPDPSKYGKIEGVGGCQRPSPIIFNSTLNRFKNISSSFGRFLPEVDSKDQTFHSYNTLEQRLFRPNNISPLTKLEKLTVDGSVLKETGDIFGNLFYIVNETVERNRNLDNFNPVAPVLDRFVTTFETLPTSDEKETIASIRSKDKSIEVFNLLKNTIAPIEEQFESIFNRYSYNNVLYDQLTNNKYQDLEIFETVFFIKTSNYLVIDNIDYKDGIFSPLTFSSTVKEYNKGIIIDQATTTISNISNPVRIGDDIFYIKLTSDPATTSPTNLKFFDFDLFKYNKNTKKEVNLVTSNTQNQSYFAENFTFNLDTNLVEITNISFAYNSKQNKFISTTNFRDLNHACFIHVLIFGVVGNMLTITDNYVITPDNTTNTINFYSPSSLVNNFVAGRQAITTTPTHDVKHGTLRF